MSQDPSLDDDDIERHYSSSLIAIDHLTSIGRIIQRIQDRLDRLDRLHFDKQARTEHRDVHEPIRRERQVPWQSLVAPPRLFWKAQNDQGGCVLICAVSMEGAARALTRSVSYEPRALLSTSWHFTQVEDDSEVAGRFASVTLEDGSSIPIDAVVFERRRQMGL